MNHKGYDISDYSPSLVTNAVNYIENDGVIEKIHDARAESKVFAELVNVLGNENDAKSMFWIFECELEEVTSEYRLGENEVNRVTEQLQSLLKDNSKIKDMYAPENKYTSSDRHGYARRLLREAMIRGGILNAAREDIFIDGVYDDDDIDGRGGGASRD